MDISIDRNIFIYIYLPYKKVMSTCYETPYILSEFFGLSHHYLLCDSYPC